MTLHDKDFPKIWGKFHALEGLIDPEVNHKNLAKLIAKYREDISEVLNLNEAEWSDDENDLKTLIDRLNDKRDHILKPDLWKSGPKHIDFSDEHNTDIINFWEKIIGSWWNHAAIDWSGLASVAESNTLKTKIKDTLGNIQFLHDDWNWNPKSWKLFWWTTENMADFSKTAWYKRIQKVLQVDEPLVNPTGESIETVVNAFVDSVSKTWGNPFLIYGKKLNDLDERKTSIRIAWYLYMAYKIIEKNCLTVDLRQEIEKVINEQIIPFEIPKIKWLHNAKVELEDLEPEYETLKDLNAHPIKELPLWTKNLSTSVQTFQEDLTGKYEQWVATWLQEYKLWENPADWQKKTKIHDAWWTTYTALFIDRMWNTGDLSSPLNHTKSVDFYIVNWANKAKIGNITLSNLTWNAKIKIDIDDEASINKSFSDAWMPLPTWPLDIELPLKWIRHLSTKRRVSVAKLVKFALAPWGWGWGGWWGGGWATVDVLASISNVTEVSREEAERVAEEQLRKRYEDLPRYSPDRVNLFLRRDYIKERYVRKIMDSEKWLSRKDRDINATDRQQLQKSQDTLFDDEITTVDIETKCKNTYTEIDKLCKSYMWTPPAYISSMTDEQFKNDFKNNIIDHDPPLDKPSILKYLWRQRSLTYSSNILFRMKMFVAHQRMVNNISTYIAWWHTDPEIDAYCRAEIKNYMNSYNDLPSFLSTIWTTLDDPNFVTRIKANAVAISNIAAQTMKLKINIIKKWSAAYKIKQKRWFKASVWNFYEAWPGAIRKEWPTRLVETIWWTRWIVDTWLMIWAWLAWGIFFWPAGTAIATGSAVWLRTLFSKYSHYTKEHEWQMKNEAVDLANYEAERARLQSIVWGKKWYQTTKRLRWKDKYDARHWFRYVRTTHWMSAHTNTLASEIEAKANKDSVLTPTEKDELEKLVAEWFARLRYYKETWQNFLWSDNVDKAEEDYKNLYSKLISWAKRLWRMDGANPNKMDKATIEWHPNYGATMNKLESWYKEAKSRFENMRRWLWYWWAIITGWVAWWLSYLTTRWRFWKETVWAGDEHNFVIPGSESSGSPMSNIEAGGGTNSLHDVFKSAMSANPNASWYDLIVSPEVDSKPIALGSSSHTYSTLSAKISSIRATIPPTDTKTLNAFDKAMELHSTMPPRYKRSALEKAIAYAGNNWADIGNQYLFWERFAETVKDTLLARSSAGTTGVPVDKILFWKTAANAVASVSWSAWSLTERSMNWVLRIKSTALWVWVPLSRNTFKRHEWNVKPTSSSSP